MLKKIPSEQPDTGVKRRHKRKSVSKKKAAENLLRQQKNAPNSKLQKKSAVVSHSECRIIHLVGMKMVNYGKRTFKTNDEFRKMIRDVQISVLCLQKQQRQFLRGEQNKKKK